MTRYRRALIALVGLAAVAVVVTALVRTSPSTTATGRGAAALIPAEQRTRAADFTGLDGWLNSPPLTVTGLQGKVVLVDFWTFSCVNCVRTIPHLQHLEQSYGSRGLVIIGMHSPEFDFEKQRSNVAAAVQRFGVTWPVALDSQMATWNAYGNNYWPAEYLLDQSGRVAYIHAGEGEYDVTESAIAALLNVTTSPAPAPATPDISGQTPELYAGSDRGSLADGEGYAAVGQSRTYPDPGAPNDSDRILVTGSWADHVQYLEATSSGHVRLRFSARDLYVVAGPASATAQVGVTLDGAPLSPSQRGQDLGPGGGLAVTSQQLYHLATGLSGDRHLLDLAVPTGFRLYTFTFG
jgi:thiol-disulfide isomerase/thioredoxin